MPGPTLRTDIVDIYVFRRRHPQERSAGVQYLQLRRAVDPLRHTWQPVMGHIEPGESAVQAALRELQEETGFAPLPTAPLSQAQAQGLRPGLPETSPPQNSARRLLNFWQLESIHPFFLASVDAIVLSPGFAAEVAPDAEPVLDETHDAHRWVPRAHADRCFLWPNQRHALTQIERDILDPTSPVAAVLRIPM
jgi:dATP pyrophosphohydrolase